MDVVFMNTNEDVRDQATQVMELYFGIQEGLVTGDYCFELEEQKTFEI
jgi:hypothetical protein